MAQVTKGSAAPMMMTTPLVSLTSVSVLAAHTSCNVSYATQTHLPSIADSPHPNGDRKVKGPYFEFAKKKWETEDTFRCVLFALVCI